MSYHNRNNHKIAPVKPEKVTPHNLQAEGAVIGACLRSEKALTEVLQMGLLPDHFNGDIHRTIFRGMMTMHHKGWPVDLITVGEQLQKWKRLDSVGGAAYLAALVEKSDNTQNVAAYATIVIEKAALRSLLHLFENGIKKVYEGEDEARKIIYEIGPAFKSIAENGVLLSEARAAQKRLTHDEHNQLL